jgi:radical SAM superfamily enzyme YgiQ (UPF0313 family)
MIVDDCPFGDLDYLKELLLLLTRLRKENHFSLMMQFHVLPLTRDEQIAPLMKSAGVQTLLMGFETVSDTSLQEENKGTTKADNIAAIQVCREFDILPYGYFVAGFDADSPDTVDEIFSFILEYQLVAQVLPMGVMDERTLDPYSFGATIFVSHRPKQMSPVQLQKRLLSGYQKIFAPTRFLTMKTLREKLYQSALGPSWKKWKPRVESHINYLTLLEKFN